ncbi:MAG: hypothetical protein R3B70_43295 [Polyangiaceae bacterium]
MSDDDDDLGQDDLLKTIEMRAAHLDPTSEIEALLGELDDLLKNGDVVAALSARGINSSVALLAAQGLSAYLRGEKAQGADDLQAAAEEIRDRLGLQSAERRGQN